MKYFSDSRQYHVQYVSDSRYNAWSISVASDNDLCST